MDCKEEEEEGRERGRQLKDGCRGPSPGESQISGEQRSAAQSSDTGPGTALQGCSAFALALAPSQTRRAGLELSGMGWAGLGCEVSRRIRTSTRRARKYHAAATHPVHHVQRGVPCTSVEAPRTYPVRALARWVPGPPRRWRRADWASEALHHLTAARTPRAAIGVFTRSQVPKCEDDHEARDGCLPEG